MKIKLVFLGVVLCICCILLSIISQVAFSGYISCLFNKHANFAEAGIKPQDSFEVANMLSGYLMGIQGEYAIQGRADINSLFSEKEILHMQDVRAVFKVIINLFIVFSIVAVFLFFLCKGKIRNNKYYYLGLAIPIVILIFIAAMAMINFDKVFIYMHKLLFTNDLWILRPGEDFIISLMPISFFVDMAVSGVMVFIVLMLFCIIPALFKRNN